MATLSAADLGEMPLFGALATEQLEQLLDRHRETTHQAEQLIVMEQDWGESLFLLRSGLAKVRTYTADGDEVVIARAGKPLVKLVPVDTSPRRRTLGFMRSQGIATADLKADFVDDINAMFS